MPFPFEVLIIDNASTDGSPEMLNAIEDERVKVRMSEENLGFAGGNNVVLEDAQGQFFLLLNPDTVVENDSVAELLSFATKNPGAGIWGGTTYFEDGSLNPTYCWNNQSVWSLLCQALGLTSLFRSNRLFNPEGVGFWNTEAEREVDIVSGCFFLTRQSLWRELNGFDQSFFMYGEEADFCNRAMRLGHSPKITSKAKIVHHGGASERIRSQKLIRLLKSKMMLIERHFNPTLRWLGLRLLAAWPASRLLAHEMLSLLGRQSSKEHSKAWRIVWQDRANWSGLSDG